MSKHAIVMSFVLAAIGCGPSFTLPMTADQLLQLNSGPALVAYLGQPDANPSVCDLRARGPHLLAFSDEVHGALVDGFVKGRIEPVMWRRCVELVIKNMPPTQVASLFDELLRAYQSMVKSDHLQSDPAFAERVATIQRLYLERAEGLDGHPGVTTAIFDDLRDALAKRKLGPVGKSFAEEVIGTVDVSHGNWQGRAVDLALMDALAAAGNEMTLERFASRLPQPDLREQAARRLVRIHIALSPFDEVRKNAAKIEEAVVRDGHNRVVIAEHRLARAWFDDNKTPVRYVVVRQHVWDRTATLLGSGENRPGLSVLPELALRGSLFAELKGISRPVTLCGAAQKLDPTPCIAVSDVALDNPLAYLDDGGVHFRDDIAENEVVPLAANSAFSLPVRLANLPAAALQWGLGFEKPDDLDFGAPVAARGPDLEVRVDHPNRDRYVYTVSGAQGYAAVVQAADLGAFHVDSRGGNGPSGSTGASGSTGSAGSECSAGGPGGNGGPGGDGGRGGNGGNVHVVISCQTAGCDVAAVQRTIASIGGYGGAGGSGGQGGQGGQGGAARSQTTHTDSNGATVVDDAGCSAGSNGSNGASGSRGSDGRPGSPGRVTVDIR